MNFWTAMVAIAGIMGIVAITRYRMELRNTKSADPDPDKAERAETVRRLEERVETLERIVTDDKEALKRRFDDL